MPDAPSSSQMKSIRYFAGPGAEVSFTTLSGASCVAAFDAAGYYTTSDEAEIMALDALADAPGSPLAHADAKATASKTPKPEPTPDTMSEDTDAADR